MHYEKVTRDIRVRVEPRYVEEQSAPAENLYFWAYHIQIANESGKTVQLRSRHWRITDANGRVQEVRGAGVVGEQPVLQPGASFQYTSGCPLPTPSGIMVGTYDMETPDGETFPVDVPAFSLDRPQARRTVN